VKNSKFDDELIVDSVLLNEDVVTETVDVDIDGITVIVLPKEMLDVVEVIDDVVTDTVDVVGITALFDDDSTVTVDEKGEIIDVDDSTEIFSKTAATV